MFVCYYNFFYTDELVCSQKRPIYRVCFLHRQGKMENCTFPNVYDDDDDNGDGAYEYRSSNLIYMQVKIKQYKAFSGFASPDINTRGVERIRDRYANP